jgi:membrane-associated PAP2 superfamily phosphatase
MASVLALRGPKAPAFLAVHALLVPGAFALAAVACARLGVDRAVSDLVFDPVQGAFPARTWPLLELFGHRIAKSAVLALWLALLAAAAVAPWVSHLSAHRRVLWATVAALAAGPLIVVALKGINSHPCPWDLKRYGGLADASAVWFVPPSEAGRCFPSGHASGGFSLVALAFAARAVGRRRLAVIGLALALGAGVLAGAVRVAQGAHFVGHNLWSAAIAWCAAALVFAPLMRERGERP